MSLKLTAEERRFLDHHKVSLSEVMDIGGATVGKSKDRMRAAGAIIAVNTTACREGGHKMRSRGGTCVMCDPAQIAYMRRHEKPGYVYLAASPKGRLVKIGSTADVWTREKGLNNEAYGGQSDWQIRHYVIHPQAGRIEFLIQKELARYQAAGTYLKEGLQQECRELFACTPKVAMDAFERAVA